jgi:hypothetical protein
MNPAFAGASRGFGAIPWECYDRHSSRVGATMFRSRILVLVLFVGIGGCTNVLADRDPAAVALAEPSAINGPNAPAAEAQTVRPSTVTSPTRRESEFVRQNRRLFSKAEDERPSAVAGSAEWDQQQERDARREKELQKAIQICNC